MADQGAIISEFMQLTGSDEERTKFFLQSSNWDLQTAIGTFYDNDMVEEGNLTGGDVIPNIEMPTPEIEPTPKPTSNASRTHSSNRFATLDSYKDAEADPSGEEDGQAFYAGGSETSGQQILGPKQEKNGKGNDGDNQVRNIFDQARQHGAEEVSGSSSQSSTKRSTMFQGAGFKLGSDIQQSEQVGTSLAVAPPPEPLKKVVIKFWQNGFSIDNGPLRDMQDPSNKEFLASISRGDVPAELRQQSHNGEVHVNMEDHSQEEYVKPKETMKAFGGTGFTLGSPAPQVQTNSPAVSQQQKPLSQSFVVDESKPVTTIQIRLADGTRLISKFNHDSTVGDVRKAVQNSRPNTGSFNLMTTFPNKVLSDNSQTLADGKLINAVIVQRMT